MNEDNRPKIFISYSHEDRHWKDYIKQYFNQNLYDVWDDGRIQIGDNWYYEISDSLYKANIALLLLSPDFINSDFINDEELPVFFERHKKGELLIVKVFLRAYDYDTISWITEKGKSLQGYIAPDKLLSKYVNEDSKKGLRRSVKLDTKVVNLVSIVRDTYRKKENEVLKSYYDQNIKESDKKLDYFKNKDYKNPIKSNNIFVHFRQDTLEDNKYIVDIYARYKEIHLNKTLRDIVIEDINSLDCQQEFMENFHQFRKNIPIHFIVPPELYFCNFRLWKDNTELIDLFHPIYLHSNERYIKDVDEYEFMIEDEWNNEFLPQNVLCDTLHPISSSDDKYGLRTKKIGVYYKYQPTCECIERRLEIAKIALWSHKDQSDRYNCIDENFNKIKLKDLPDKLQECEHVSLLWDDMSMLVDLKKELEI